MKQGIAVILIMLLLTACGAAEKAPATVTTQPATTAATVPETTAAPEPVLAEGVYWNLDRALYDGKSEAGMSGRLPGEDGLYHVRFFCDGEVVEMTVADKRVINHIEVNDLMGLFLDESGLVVDVADIDEMPVEQFAWQFYVKSVENGTVVCDSSMSLNGMEQAFALTENVGVYDMTGRSGQSGTETTLKKLDRVKAIADENGVVTQVFIVSRKK